ncbi:MAG TPA: HAD hydrolase family protein [Thermoanaerobaculaceae bacterium]|nr:HAD hydrolase family protein [Thermoanaerobaculaceae bacterium]
MVNADAITLDQLSDELLERACRVRLVLTDCDGVLTEAGVFVSWKGEELKCFSLRDGMGVERLRTYLGVETGMITCESSGPAKARADKLRLGEIHLGVRDKLSAVGEIIARLGLRFEEVAYIGDDANDAPVLARVGLAACPADAFFLIRQIVHYVTPNPGGHGAFRDLAELILLARMHETPYK